MTRKAHSDRDWALVNRLRAELGLPGPGRGLLMTRTPPAGRPTGTTDQKLDATRARPGADGEVARRAGDEGVTQPEAGKHE